jgi:uncharacterized membrane protein YbhN (UPF0104 family)
MTSEPEQTAFQTPEADQEEEPKRPSLIKQVVPWVITALIFYWIFSRVDLDKVWAEMQKANLWVLIPAMAGLVGVQTWLEIWPFGTSYKWFADRRPSYWQVAVARVGAFPLQALFAPLAGVQVLVYLVRVYKMRLALALSSDIFTLYPDQLFGGIGIFIAVVLVHLTGAEPLHWFFYALCAVNLILYPLWFGYWMTDLKDRLWPRLRDLAIFQSWKLASWGQVVKMFFMRLPIGLATMGSMYACLRAFDVHVPITIFLIAVPLIMATVFLPTSVGGLGGPQAVSILFYNDYASEEIIVAQSFLWSTLFTLFRILAGTVFLYPMFKGFQDPDKIHVPAAPAPEPKGGTEQMRFSQE